MKSSILKLVGILSLLGPMASNSMSITYDVNRAVGTGSVIGTIVTDGTQGTLVAANITDFSLTLYDGTDSFTIAMSNGASIFESGPSYLTASATGLLYDFSGTPQGQTIFFQGGIGGGWSWTMESNASSSAFGVEEVYQSGINPPVATANRIGNVVIATPQVVQLTEPGSLALLGLGFSMLALTYRRKQRHSALT